jgi:mRNA-degrading endonuclease RelE of RelBE toxin-antitoxin system
MYKIILHSDVLKRDLRRIPSNALNAVMTAIEERVAVRPYDFKALSGKEAQGLHRLRVANYRIVYEVTEAKKLATIFAIDVRSKIYDLISRRIND